MKSLLNRVILLYFSLTIDLKELLNIAWKNIGYNTIYSQGYYLEDVIRWNG